MKQKLFVLSMDAMVWEDVEYLMQKPNFRKIMEHAAGVKHVRTLYPSITYPAHVSIMTGCYCGKHGVFTNGKFKAGAGSTLWHYDGSIVKTSDIFESAKKAGLTTASVFWPVTGNNKNIDYLIDEYFFPENETPEEGFSKYGANEDALRVVKENMDRWPVNYHNRVGKLNKTHTFDDFLMGCACSMITDYQPDLLMVHNCIIDTLRHRYGIFNEFVTEGLDMTDEWLGEVIEAMEKAGVYEDTNFVILSDHGQMDFARRLKTNVILRRGGYVDVDENGKVTDWRAFSQSNGMSCTIWVKNPEDRQEIYDYLCRLRDEGVWGFDEVLTREQVAEEYDFDGDFDFVLETDGYTAFGDGVTEPIVNPIDLSDYRLGMATHGYKPEKGPQPVFLCKGPSFIPDALIERGEVINEAPTLAATFGGTMPDAQGQVIKEILK